MSLVGPLGKRKNSFNIVRQMNVDDATLKKIAEALGIPANEHNRIESISGEIVISPARSLGAGGTYAQGGSAPESSDGNPPPTSATGGER
jgi:hypothetical protein